VPAPRVLLVRHGESTWNAEGRWQGQADPPLSRRGRAQARAAATHLPPAAAAVASDLDRARETADLLVAPHGLAVVIDVDLRERDAGAFSGLTRSEIHDRFPGALPDDPLRRPDDEGLLAPPGWEHDDDLVVRAWRGLERLARTLVEVTGAEGVAARPGDDPGPGPVGIAVTHSGLIYAVERDLGLAGGRIANLEGRWLERTPAGWVGGDRHLLLDPTHDAVTRPTSL
jgi:broad specificity phosphatase PhoE